MENVFEPMASFNQDVFEPLENFEGMKEALLRASLEAKSKTQGMKEALLRASEEARNKARVVEDLKNTLNNRNQGSNTNFFDPKKTRNRITKNPDYKANMQVALLNLVLRKTGISSSNFYGWFDSLDVVKKNRNRRLQNTILTKSSNLSSLEEKIINALSMYKSKFGKAFELDLPLFITNEDLRFELKKQCESDKKNRFFFDPKKTRNRIRDCKMSVDSQIDSKYSKYSKANLPKFSEEDDFSNFGLLDRIKKTLGNSKSRKNLRISSSEHPLNFLIDKTDLINIKGAIRTSNFDGNEYFDDDYSNFGLKEWFNSTFGKKDISTQSTPTSITEEKKVFGMPRKTAIGVGVGLIAVGITAFFLIKKKK